MPEKIKTAKTIKLMFPQWQGGNNPSYQLGAELLAFLAPENDAPLFRVPTIKAPMEETPSATPNTTLVDEDGILGRAQIKQQLASAYEIIENQQPDKIVVFGGDCLVDLAPFSYLSQRYGNDFGILWIDAHPDVMTPKQYNRAHAHILNALMGNGDAELTTGVKKPVAAQNIMIAGMHSPNAYEDAFIKQHDIKTCTPEQLLANPEIVNDWIKQQNIKHLAIHFDLDVLDPQFFRSLLFSAPHIDPHLYDDVAKGKLTMETIVQLITHVDKTTNIVAIGLTELLAWDMLNLKAMLARLPLIR